MEEKLVHATKFGSGCMSRWFINMTALIGLIYVLTVIMQMISIDLFAQSNIYLSVDLEIQYT